MCVYIIAIQKTFYFDKKSSTFYFSFLSGNVVLRVDSNALGSCRRKLLEVPNYLNKSFINNGLASNIFNSVQTHMHL